MIIGHKSYAALRTNLVAVGLSASLLTSVLLAQEPKTKSAASDHASLVRANRIMEKLDKDGNGTFEKSENSAAWKRYRKLDTNQDQSISIDELRKEQKGELDSGGERKLDVVYKKTEQGDLLLDLYYPAKKNAGSKYPIVVYTHGGGWAAGSNKGITRGSFKVVFEKLLDHGFAVASIGYQLCRPNTSVTMRDCVIDCKDAVRYLAKNGDKLQLDSQRVFAMGDSAGGQITQILVLASSESLPGDKELAAVPYKMVAGVSWYGPCDFEKTELFNHDDRADFRDRFGPRILGSNSDPADKLKLYREMSPVNYLSESSPPLLMIQGDKDTTIPVKHAHYMKKKAAATNADVETIIIHNAGHNWRRVDADIDPSRETIVLRTVQFLVDHL